MRYISVLSTLVTFAFAASVFSRYLRKRGTHLLLWSVGLALYGLGTLTEAIMMFTFSPAALKVWYLSGAMLTAAWLGEGTVHLLVRKRNVAKTLTIVLALVSLAAIGLIVVAPIARGAAFDTTKPVSAQYRDILVRNGWIIALTIILNIYGSITLIGGALYSVYIFWRKRILRDRMIGNILIAIGALMPAMAGTLIKMGLADWLYLSELLGAVLMYVGFLEAVRGKD